MNWLLFLLLIAAAAAGAGLCLRWKGRWGALERELRGQVDRLRLENQKLTAEATSRQQLVFDSMSEGVLILDDEGRIQFANRAFRELFGLAEEPRSRTLIEAVRSHELNDVVERVRSRAESAQQELKVPGATERWVQVNAAPIAGQAGAGGGLVVVFYDLTRLKQLESTRRDFVANVSHELRTPLSLIKGYVETLQDGAKDNPELARKFLDTIARNAERLQLLIEDLLVISELESGRVRLNLETVPLARVVQKVFGDFRPKAEAKGVALLDRTAAICGRADERRLEQVVGNLVDNALKYGAAGGAIAVGAREAEGDFIEVSVRNDGPGIPPEALARLFERFYRVDRGRSREDGGTGLGLAIVKHIVQTHGGKVRAASEPGKGATFYFTIPRAAGTSSDPGKEVTGS